MGLSTVPAAISDSIFTLTFHLYFCNDHWIILPDLNIALLFDYFIVRRFHITHNRPHSNDTDERNSNYCSNHNPFFPHIFFFARIPTTISSIHVAMMVMLPMGVMFTRLGISSETER